MKRLAALMVIGTLLLCGCATRLVGVLAAEEMAIVRSAGLRATASGLALESEAVFASQIGRVRMFRATSSNRPQLFIDGEKKAFAEITGSNSFRWLKSGYEQTIPGTFYSIKRGYLNVNVRTGPGTNYPVYKSIRSNELVIVIDESPGWRKVQLDVDVVGWISDKLLDLAVSEINKNITSWHLPEQRTAPETRNSAWQSVNNDWIPANNNSGWVLTNDGRNGGTNSSSIQKETNNGINDYGQNSRPISEAWNWSNNSGDYVITGTADVRSNRTTVSYPSGFSAAGNTAYTLENNWGNNYSSRAVGNTQIFNSSQSSNVTIINNITYQNSQVITISNGQSTVVNISVSNGSPISRSSHSNQIVIISNSSGSW